MVISDASDDGTDEIVRRSGSARRAAAADDGARRQDARPERGRRSAHGEIVVFSDANAMYRRMRSARWCATSPTPPVGAVVGESTYADAEGGAQTERIALLEDTKSGSSASRRQLGSTVGGDGAIYAIRRALYRDMRADALSDFVNPMQIVMSGHRCIYEPEARSVEEAAEGFDKEFRRKVRIVNRAWRATWTLPALLNPLRFGWFSLEIVSHKLLRWLMPVFLVGFLLANIAIAGRHWFYAAALATQLAFYALAVLGHLLRRATQRAARLRRAVLFRLW